MSARETLCVVFGAGASHDCIPNRSELAEADIVIAGLPEKPWRLLKPPLTKDLAAWSHLRNWVLGHYPDAVPVIATLRERLDGDPTDSLEQVLAEYAEMAFAGDTDRMRHLMATRFYLRDLLIACSEYTLSVPVSGGATSYVAFVLNLWDWAKRTGNYLCLVSFNYDYLLDHACSTIWRLEYRNDIASYIRDDHVGLFKPHGSAHWGYPVRDPESGRTRMAKANYVIGHAEMRTGGRIETCWTPLGDDRPTASIPALALPLHGKNEFVMPDEHRIHLRGMPPISRLITVGWRAAEDNFIELLKNQFIQTKPIAFLNVTGGDDPDADHVALLERLRPWTGDRLFTAAGNGLHGDGFSTVRPDIYAHVLLE